MRDILTTVLLSTMAAGCSEDGSTGICNGEATQQVMSPFSLGEQLVEVECFWFAGPNPGGLVWANVRLGGDLTLEIVVSTEIALATPLDLSIRIQDTKPRYGVSLIEYGAGFEGKPVDRCNGAPVSGTLQVDELQLAEDGAIDQIHGSVEARFEYCTLPSYRLQDQTLTISGAF